MDVATVLKVLIWGNFSFGVLVLIYRSSWGADDHKTILLRFVVAKLTQSGAWTLVMTVGLLPFFVAINIGNSLLYFALFMESRVILDICGIQKKWPYRFQFAVFLSLVLAFNVLEFTGDRVASRISVSLLAIMALLSFPGMACFVSVKRSRLMVFTFFHFFLFARNRDGVRHSDDPPSPAGHRGGDFPRLRAYPVYRRNWGFASR